MNWSHITIICLSMTAYFTVLLDRHMVNSIVHYMILHKYGYSNTSYMDAYYANLIYYATYTIFNISMYMILHLLTVLIMFNYKLVVYTYIAITHKSHITTQYWFGTLTRFSTLCICLQYKLCERQIQALHCQFAYILLYNDYSYCTYPCCVY